MIHQWTKDIFEKYLKPKMRVIELGDQLMDISENGTHLGQMVNGQFVRPRSVDYYRPKAVEIVSIDNAPNAINALNLDLSKAISADDLPKPGDMVTDFGTSEHVKNLFYCLKNVFNLCKEGGIMIHCNPETGHFPNHNSYHYFTQDFWVEYSRLTKLELLECKTQAAYHNFNTGMERYAVLRKNNRSSFPTRKEFDAVYKKHIKRK